MQQRQRRRGRRRQIQGDAAGLGVHGGRHRWVRFRFRREVRESSGSWVTTSQGKSIALLISGKKVALVGEHVCSGTAGDEMGMQMLTLKCADGNTDRNMGQVKSVDATTLKVSWEGLGDDTFRKTDDGKLPSGFPTMGLPKS